jgi:hypothetical protein
MQEAGIDVLVWSDNNPKALAMSMRVGARYVAAIKKGDWLERKLQTAGRKRDVKFRVPKLYVCRRERRGPFTPKGVTLT